MAAEQERVPPEETPEEAGSAKANKKEYATIEVCGRELRVSSPSKPFFPERGLTKLDLVNYYLECAPAVVRGLRERPTVMKRWVDGVAGEPFFQKRVPDRRRSGSRPRPSRSPAAAPRASSSRTMPRTSSGA